MIEFPCHCSHRFSLPEDMAGALIQCPSCGRLNDVPTTDELARMAPDGTYHVESAEPEPPRLEKLRHYFGQRMSIEPDLDLRPTPQELRRAGERDDPLQSTAAHPYPRPKYDPETGQLIRPIDFKPQPEQAIDPNSIPVARAAPFAYASPDLQSPPGLWGVALGLLMPASAVAIFFVFFFHALAKFTLDVVLAGFYFAAPVPVFLVMLIVAHYGCVVDETGPSEHDEVPRMFRNFEWHEDIWTPFTGFMGALMLAYLPALLVLKLLTAPAEMVIPLAAVLVVLGTFFFPALLLTTITSGTALNLRPDRVLGVVRSCGPGYLLALILWVATVAIYGVALVGLALPGSLSLGWSGMVVTLPNALLWPILIVGIYLMHLFGWIMGRLYRGNHDRFPWTLQRHIPVRKPPPADQPADAGN